MNTSITGRLAAASCLLFLAACVPAQTFNAADAHKAGPRNTVVIPKREPAKRAVIEDRSHQHQINADLLALLRR